MMIHTEYDDEEEITTKRASKNALKHTYTNTYTYTDIKWGATRVVCTGHKIEKMWYVKNYL